MLGVRWEQLKIGPTLRHEADSRLYLSLLQQRDGYVTGVRRLASLAAPRVPEPMSLTSPIDIARGRRLVVFTGLSDYFEQLYGHEDFLAEELLAVTRPERLPHLNLLRPIIFHIRLGDFGAARDLAGLVLLARRIPSCRRTFPADRTRERRNRPPA